MRKGNSAENFAVVRHIASNLLGQEKTAKLGKMNKRLKAAWDDKYLAKERGLNNFPVIALRFRWYLQNNAGQ